MAKGCLATRRAFVDGMRARREMKELAANDERLSITGSKAKFVCVKRQCLEATVKQRDRVAPQTAQPVPKQPVPKQHLFPLLPERLKPRAFRWETITGS